MESIKNEILGRDNSVENDEKEITTEHKFDGHSFFSDDFLNSDSIKVFGADEKPLPSSEFKERGFLQNEGWKNITLVDSLVYNISENLVFCECLIDRENLLFQKRSFPKNLFLNIPNLAINSPIQIKTSSKPGSIKIDIFNGKNRVNIKAFSINQNWDSLKDSNLSEPF